MASCFEGLAVDVASLKAQANGPDVGEASGGNSNNHGKAPMYGPRIREHSHWAEDSEEGEHLWSYCHNSKIPYTRIEFPKFRGGDPWGGLWTQKNIFTIILP